MCRTSRPQFDWRNGTLPTCVLETLCTEADVVAVSMLPPPILEAPLWFHGTPEWFRVNLAELFAAALASESFEPRGRMWDVPTVLAEMDSTGRMLMLVAREHGFVFGNAQETPSGD